MFTICLISVRAALAALGPINLSRVILPVDRRIGVRPVGRVGGEGTEKTKHAIPISLQALTLSVEVGCH